MVLREIEHDWSQQLELRLGTRDKSYLVRKGSDLGSRRSAFVLVPYR